MGGGGGDRSIRGREYACHLSLTIGCESLTLALYLAASLAQSTLSAAGEADAAAAGVGKGRVEQTFDGLGGLEVKTVLMAGNAQGSWP